MISKLKPIIDGIFKILLGASNILLVILTLLVAFEVLSRALFNTSLIFVTPLTGVVFPWMVFLAIVGANRNNEHISVNFLLNKLPSKTKKGVKLINKLVMLFFSVLMLFSSYRLSNDVANIMEPIINVSRFWLYFSMVVSFAGSSLVIIAQIVQIILNKDKEEELDDLVNDN
ncbi:TRAP transporter small permease [Oceanobacillus sp. M60]